MGQVTLCLGNYAQNPYNIELMCAKVYCVEELCYLLRENAFLLDRQIVDKRLADWIEEECGLPELAKSLRGYLHAGCSAAAFVSTILEYTGYCGREEIRGVEQLLKNNDGLDGGERLKIHADYLVQRGRYAAAVKEYGQLLDREEAGEELKAKLHHNRGTAYAGMFLFAQAAEEYKQAYELTGNETELMHCLAAARLQLTEREYVDRIAGRPAVTEASLTLEGRLKQILSQWEASGTGEEYARLKELKETGSMAEYYDEAGRAAAGLKDDYRKKI